MAESGGGHRRREPPPVSPEEEGANASWRLNVEEFCLSNQTHDHRQHHRFYTFRSLLRKLSKQLKVAEYSKKQESLLEGLNEMETMTETCGLPGTLTEVYASVGSRSLAVIASTMDSLLDLLSGFILWFTAHAMKNRNQYHYPIGKKLMQPVIALYTINTWAKTVIENVGSLIGRTAPPGFPAKLIYLIWNHHEQIKHMDNVRAYTFGAHYFVEVDIVLPEDMLLHQAHNIGETLQEKLEQLQEVERAFVYIDFEFTHRPEHKAVV
ncbi:Metal tolerance protein 9 [Glycine soja]|uniref:Metal tolerance protein 9 n=1 Tax=Glycine soja TaxID=3848 RepID=A0A445JFL1_GLYSO|nr:Metal tolerance protein 9 [Glycine soja]